MIWIDPKLSACFSKNRPAFDVLMQLRGEVFREHKNRRTQQICLPDSQYFLKQHHGIGWREIFRNLREGRFPILDARREWRAIQRLQHLGIATLEIRGVGWRGWNPAARQSFLLTQSLPPHITLEALADEHTRNPLPLLLKWRLLKAVGTLAGTLHRHGINHRDFYLCHLLLDRRSLALGNACLDPLIYVIDLHRAGLRRKTPLRWMQKDLAGLDFSSAHAKLSTQDRLRFKRAYENAADRSHSDSFWQKVKERGERLTRRHGHPAATTHHVETAVP